MPVFSLLIMKNTKVASRIRLPSVSSSPCFVFCRFEKFPLFLLGKIDGMMLLMNNCIHFGAAQKRTLFPHAFMWA